MAWISCVVLVLAGVWCVGVDGLPNISGLSFERKERNDGRDQVSVHPPSIPSCQGINSLLRLLRSALEDLRVLQESHRSEGRHLKARHHVKERRRAIQWARKLRRRLLRLCPRQTTASSHSSLASGKLWESAAGGYLMLEAMHGERPVRTLPLRRHKLSHLLDILLSLFPRQEETTTNTTPSHDSVGPKRSDNSVGLGNYIVEVEEENDEVKMEEEENLVEAKKNDLEVEDKDVQVEEDTVEVKEEDYVENNMEESQENALSEVEMEDRKMEEKSNAEDVEENTVEEEEEDEMEENTTVVTDVEDEEVEEKNKTEEVEEDEEDEETVENVIVKVEDSVEDKNLEAEDEEVNVEEDEVEEENKSEELENYTKENFLEVEEDLVEVAVEVGVEEVMRQVPDTFLSLALSPRLMERGWLNFNTSSPRLLTLVGALAPAILRVGGSAANFLTYDPTPVAPSGGQLEGEGRKSQQEEEGGRDDESQEEGSGEEEEEEEEEVEEMKNEGGRSKDEGGDINDEIQGSGGRKEGEGSGEEERNEGKKVGEEDGEYEAGRCYDSHFAKPALTNFTITSEDWMQLLRFTQVVGMQLLFDLNQFYREPEGNWDPSNARLLLRDACTSGFTSVTWQLGNEPNAYKHKYGIVLSGKQTAGDYESLRNVLEEECPSPVLLVGPDVTRPKHHHPHHHYPQTGLGVDSMEFLESFLTASTVNLTALTWHQYYVDGHNATEREFVDPAVMDQLAWQVAQVAQIRDHLAPGKPIWLTESGSAWGGGAVGLSNSYVGGFLWLDKLGVAARGGVEVVARQTLYQACYALLSPDLTPNPDYWLSLLYKRLVGGRVLNLRMPSAPPTLRLYAHCLHPHAHVEESPEGGVVVLGMNLGKRALSVSLGDKLAASPVLQYLLQPVNGDLKAREVLLNGAKLQLGSRGELPPLNYATLSPGPFTLPPTSLGYWVLPRARAPACL